MSPILHLGPLALAADRLAAVALVWLFLAIGSSRRFADDAGKAATISTAVGFVIARLAFVATHAADFRAAPLDVLKVWQGGFMPLAGIVAAALVVGWLASAGNRARLFGLLLILSTAWYTGQKLLTTSVEAPFTSTVGELEALEGGPFNAATLHGKPYVLNLWADWCPPCRREMPVLAKAATNHPGVKFYFVNQGDAAEVAKRLPQQTGIAPTQVLLDRAARMSASYGGALPTTIFVHRDGTVSSVHAGEISGAALSDQIERIQEN